MRRLSHPSRESEVRLRGRQPYTVFITPNLLAKNGPPFVSKLSLGFLLLLRFRHRDINCDPLPDHTQLPAPYLGATQLETNTFGWVYPFEVLTPSSSLVYRYHNGFRRSLQ
ncbi:hypothetical protein VNO77_05921 [Canavalia gladiata]|uniref:Uncharacterized protein n=1 Tax=Canavalia gladiata TaxID=3824 RepID=A0AAN9MZ73_CANGL